MGSDTILDGDPLRRSPPGGEALPAGSGGVGAVGLGVGSDAEGADTRPDAVCVSRSSLRCSSSSARSDCTHSGTEEHTDSVTDALGYSCNDRCYDHSTAPYHNPIPNAIIGL